MSDNTPMVDKVAMNTWRNARDLVNALERGCTVDELRQRVIDLAGISCLLRGFPAEVQLRPLVTEAPNTIPAGWQPGASSQTRKATSPAETTAAKPVGRKVSPQVR